MIEIDGVLVEALNCDSSSGDYPKPNTLMGQSEGCVALYPVVLALQVSTTLALLVFSLAVCHKLSKSTIDLISMSSGWHPFSTPKH